MLTGEDVAALEFEKERSERLARAGWKMKIWQQEIGSKLEGKD